ncbi:MAG: MFS transporter [Candidatus Dormibacteria bacterium]
MSSEVGPGARRGPAVLSERRFLVFAGGQGISAIGDGVYLVALAWVTLSLTHSSVDLGLLLTTSALPRAILILGGGVLVDRWGARRVILGSDLSRALLISGLAALLLLGHGSLAALFVIAAAFGVFDALFYPAVTTVVPALVSPEQLSAANGIWQVAVEGSMIIGPPLGGVVVAISGAGAAFAIDGGSFLVAFLALLLIRRGARAAPAPAAAQGGGMRAELMAGIRAALGDPFFRALLPVVAVVNMAAGGPLNVGLPLLARSHHWGSGGYGLLFGGLGVGILLGGLVMGAGFKLPRLGVSVVVIAGLVGVLLVPLALTGALYLAMLVAAVLGVLISVVNVSISTLIQIKAPPELLGRFSSVLMFSSLSLTPASYAVSGAIARGLGVGGLFVAGAALVILASLLALSSPAIRREGPVAAIGSG